MNSVTLNTILKPGVVPAYPGLLFDLKNAGLKIRLTHMNYGASQSIELAECKQTIIVGARLVFAEQAKRKYHVYLAPESIDHILIYSINNRQHATGSRKKAGCINDLMGVGQLHLSMPGNYDYYMFSTRKDATPQASEAFQKEGMRMLANDYLKKLL